MTEEEILTAAKNGSFADWDADRLRSAFAQCEGKLNSGLPGEERAEYQRAKEMLLEAQMVESLRRSGYLLESRAIATLDDLGLFVESSPPHLDKRTGKSREIDLVAESNHYDPEFSAAKICVKTTFVVEAANNLFPMLLLTPEQWNPTNTPEDGLIPYVVTPNLETERHPFALEVNLVEEKVLENIFCQFCGFTRKDKDKALMASHPDEVYGSISKAVEYALSCRDESKEHLQRDSSGYWRIFQWRPVLLLAGNLYVWRNEKLVREQQAKLRFNLHWEGHRESVSVDIVTESALSDFVNSVLAEDRAIERKLLQLQKRREAEVAAIMREQNIPWPPKPE